MAFFFVFSESPLPSSQKLPEWRLRETSGHGGHQIRRVSHQWNHAVLVRRIFTYIWYVAMYVSTCGFGPRCEVYEVGTDGKTERSFCSHLLLVYHHEFFDLVSSKNRPNYLHTVQTKNSPSLTRFRFLPTPHSSTFFPLTVHLFSLGKWDQIRVKYDDDRIRRRY